MKTELLLNAHAKINLGLDVVGRRPDGYHELKMIMQSISLADEVRLKPLKENAVRVRTSSETLPEDERNLAYQAAALLKEQCGIRQGVDIFIQKKIPEAAGLAGGSADAAAVLRGMNALFGLGLTGNDLQRLGLSLGADVPYCVLGGLALAEGIGEKLTSFQGLTDYFLLLAKPPVMVSTKEIYESLILDDNTIHPEISALRQALMEKNVTTVTALLGNVLETAAIPRYPVIQEIKDSLKAAGALNALMSGSGPTVFGIFNNRETMRCAYEQLKKTSPAYEVIAAQPVTGSSRS